MRDAHRRVEQLEAKMRGVWPADVEAAKVRALARVRLNISVALGAVDHPAFKADDALMAGDTPTQAEADTALLQRWARQHPATLYPDDGACARITARLEEMVQRMQARKGDDEPEDAAGPVGEACRLWARMGAASYGWRMSHPRSHRDRSGLSCTGSGPRDEPEDAA